MSATTATHPPAPTTPLLERMVTKHPLGAFFILAFLGGWLLLLPTAPFKSGLGLIPIDIPAPAVMLSSSPPPCPR